MEARSVKRRISRVAVVGGVAALLLCGSVASVSAELVEMDLFEENDGLITRDTSTDLEWLDLTVTVGLSYNEVLANAGGWFGMGFRFATSAEICALFSQYAVAHSPCPTSEGAHEEIELPFGTLDPLLDLFGVTSDGGGVQAAAFGLFDDQTTGTDPTDVGFAYLRSVFQPEEGSPFDGVGVRNDNVGPSDFSTYRGSWLVLPQGSPVPSLSPPGVIGLALLLFGVAVAEPRGRLGSRS